MNRILFAMAASDFRICRQRRFSGIQHLGVPLCPRILRTLNSLLLISGSFLKYYRLVGFSSNPAPDWNT
jgi:hypothetical protein